MSINAPEPSPDELMRAVYTFAIDLMKSGQSNAEVKAALVAKGLDMDTATTIVDGLARVRGKVMRQVALRNMGIGAVVCAVGIVITGATLSNAQQNGSRYVVTWGAIIFGAIQFLRGLYYYLKSGR